MKKKKAFTILEVIIFIFIVTLITGALGYTMRGALDKGRVFRTEQGQEQLRDLLLLCIANGVNMQSVVSTPEQVLIANGLAKNPAQLLLDGWRQPFTIEAVGTDDVSVSSAALTAYKLAHPSN